MKRIFVIFTIIIVFILGLVFYGYIKGESVSVESNKIVEGLPEDVSDAIYYASMAPNSHNTQLWKVFVDSNNNKIEISLDNERTLKQVDSSNREAYISIGAFTENLVKAFEAYGYKTDIEISENNNNLVSVSYQKLNDIKKDDNMLNLIMKRHTDKSNFLNEPINNEEINKLVNGHTVLYFDNGSEEFEYLKEAEIAAMEKQSYNKDKAVELSNWLRLSDKETLDTKDGLPAEQLGLTGIIKTLYYMTTTHESATGDSYAKQSIDTTKKQLDNCSGFLIVSGDTSTKKLIETGMLLEDTWLKACDLNISVHPMSQILEEEPYCNEVQNKLKSELPVQMILRVGYVKEYGKNNHIRRDLKDYVTVRNK